MFNGEEYLIQEQTFRLTLFGKHWKRKWVDHVELFMGEEIKLYSTLKAAIYRVEEQKLYYIAWRKKDKTERRQALAMKKNIWKKVWP